MTTVSLVPIFFNIGDSFPKRSTSISISFAIFSDLIVLAVGIRAAEFSMLDAYDLTKQLF